MTLRGLPASEAAAIFFRSRVESLGVALLLRFRTAGGGSSFGYNSLFGGSKKRVSFSIMKREIVCLTLVIIVTGSARVKNELIVGSRSEK